MTRKRFTAGAVAAAAAFSILAATFSPTAGAAPRQSPEVDVPQTIAGVVASSGDGFDRFGGDYDILLAAVTAAGLVETLDAPGLDVTVWAPKDRAFVKTARDLGYTGGIRNEARAWDFLVGALTDIGGGDPIPTLTTILQFHVTPDARGVRQVLPSTEFPTLAGIDITKAAGGTKLRDQDKDFRNPRLVSPLGVRATNGTIHTINRVLLPVNL